MTAPDTTMSYDLVMSHSSGLALDHACAIALRSEAGHPFRIDEGDSWAMCSSPGRTRVLAGLGGWITGCWYSPSKRAYFVDTRGGVTVYSGLDGDPVQSTTDQLDAALFGVWGLSDELVLAWGERAGQSRMFRFDGARWAPFPAPVGMVIALHGKRADQLVAVGARGLLARWDGQRWNAVPQPTGLVLNAVWVESDDEMYATGPSGIVMEGSVHGWAIRLTAPGDLYGVAKWKGELWFGCGRAGLGKLGGGKVGGETVELVKLDDPKLPVTQLDARRDLVMTAGTHVGASADGVAFQHGFEDVMLDIAGRPRLW